MSNKKQPKMLKLASNKGYKILPTQSVDKSVELLYETLAKPHKYLASK